MDRTACIRSILVGATSKECRLSSHTRTHRYIARLAYVITGSLILAACSDTPEPAPEVLVPGVYSSAPSRPLAVVGAAQSNVGEIAVDVGGFTLYTFDQDSAEPPSSACIDACVTKWPPLEANDGMPIALPGVDPASLGVVTRSDGLKQVTLHGKPLYRFTGDATPGETKGDGADEGWHAAKPTKS